MIKWKKIEGNDNYHMPSLLEATYQFEVPNTLIKIRLYKFKRVIKVPHEVVWSWDILAGSQRQTGGKMTYQEVKDHYLPVNLRRMKTLACNDLSEFLDKLSLQVKDFSP